MEFEWDEVKRQTVLADRGIDLLAMAALLDGRPSYSYPSRRGDEARTVTIAEQNGKLLRWSGWRGRDESVSFLRGEPAVAKKERIVRYTMDEIKEMLARCEDATDYGRFDSEAEIDKQTNADPDLFVPDDWEETIVRGASTIGKENKKLVSVRYSPRVLDYFKATGKGWQTRMDAVLMAYVDRRERSRR